MIFKMKAIKVEIDKLENDLIMVTMPHDERKKKVGELDKLWDEYEALLAGTWKAIDPAIFDNKDSS